MQSNAQRDRELYDASIDWLLNRSAAELGFKGTLGSMISILEHGGFPTGVPSTDLDDFRVGWCVGEDPAEKWRRLAPVWFLVGAHSQLVLCAHYSPRNDLPANQQVAVSGALGKLACAAMVVHDGEQLTKLLTACVDKGHVGRKELIAGATKRTDAAVRGAHQEWTMWRELLGQDEPWERYRELRMAERLQGSRPARETKAVVDRWNAEYDARMARKLAALPGRDDDSRSCAEAAEHSVGPDAAT